MPFVCACSRTKVAFCVKRRDQWRRLLGLKAWPAQARSHCRVLAQFSCFDAAVACGLLWRPQIGQLQWSPSPPCPSSSQELPAARAQFVLMVSRANTHLVFCTAVAAAPRSLPVAPPRVFWCAFSIPSPFVTPRCQPHLLPSFLRLLRRLEFSVCARARRQRARKDASKPMDTKRLHCARGL